MKNIIFIGIQDKEGLMPLDSLSRTGRIIDKIINELRNYKCHKTNLFEAGFLPDKKYHTQYIYRYYFENQAVLNTKPIIICLGELVYNALLGCSYTEEAQDFIKIKHPSFIMRKGTGAINEYIKSVVDTIKKMNND